MQEMYLKSDKIEIMTNGEAGKAIKKPFKSLKDRHQNNLESIKGSEVAFVYVHLLYYKYRIKI